MPPLVKQTVPVAFGELNTKASKHLSLPGKMAVAENCVQKDRGDWAKRWGQTSLTRTSDVGTLSSPRVLGNLGSRLAQVAADGKSYFYDETANQWKQAGRSNVCTVLPGGVLGGPVTLTDKVSYAQEVIAQGYRWIFWSDCISPFVKLYYSVQDLATGQVLIDKVQLPTFTSNMGAFPSLPLHFRPVVSGSNVFVIGSWDNTGVYVTKLTAPTSSPPAATSVTGISGAVGTVTTSLDAVTLVNGDILVVRSHGGGAAALLIDPSTGLMRVTPGHVSLTGVGTGYKSSILSGSDGADGFVRAVLSGNGGTHTICTINIATLGSTSSTAMASGLNWSTGTQDCYAFGHWESATSTATIYASIHEVGGVLANDLIGRAVLAGGVWSFDSAWLRHASVNVRPFKHNGAWHMGVHHVAYVAAGSVFVVSQQESFIIDCSTKLVVAKYDRGDGPVSPWNQNAAAFAISAGQSANSFDQIPHALYVGGGVWEFCGVRRGDWERNADTTGQVEWSRIDFDNVDSIDSYPFGAPVETSGAMVSMGGCPLWHDGTAVTEAGFNLAPSLVSTGTVGSISVTSCYKWVDNNGLVHRSALSPPRSLTAGQGYVVTGLSLTAKTNVFVEFWTSNDGRTYYLASTVANPASDTVSVAAAAPDTSNPMLYASNGVLDAAPLPAARFAALWKRRVFLGGTEDGRVWYSREIVAGEPPAFNEDLAFTPPFACTALGPMADVMIIFGESKLGYVSGDGPDDAGRGSMFEVTELQADVGAESPVAAVSTPDGCIFRAANGRGFWCVTTGLQVVYVGASVADWDSEVVTGSVLIPEQNQARWVTQSGRTFVYDWSNRDPETGRGYWSTFTNQAAVAATVWKGGPVFVKSDGTVVKEVSGQYNDDGAAITMKLKTQPLQLGGLLNYQRIYAGQIVGDYKGAHTLTCRLDYPLETPAVPQTVLSKAMAAGPYVLEFYPNPGRCRQLEVTLEEASTTEGFSIAAMNLTVGVLSKRNNLPPTSRLG